MNKLYLYYRLMAIKPTRIVSNKFWLFLAGLLFLIVNQPVFAVNLSDRESALNIYDELYYYLDESNQLELTDVKHKPFIKAPESRDSNLAFGYTSASAWMKFELSNQSDLEDWIVEVSYPILDKVQLFVIRENNVVETYLTGDKQENSKRPINHRNFLFPITLQPKEEVQVFLKVESATSLRIPLTIWQQKAFFEKDQYRLVIQGAYFGILIIMMLYNLFIYFSIKEKAYLHYVFYVASYIVVQASLNGLWGQLVIDTPNELTDKSIILSLCLVILFGCSFSVSFLNLKFNQLTAYRIISTIGWLGGLSAVFAIFAPYSAAIKLSLILAVIGSVAITVTGLILWNYHGVREARFFSVAWVGFLLGSVFMMLSRLHILPDNFFTENAAQLGSAFEVTLLSFALADKFSQMRGESKKVESKAKESLTQVNSLLKETLHRLEKSNQIKNDFLATVSHELRTPMNGVIASNDLLKTVELPEEAKEYVSISEKSSAQMMELVDSMLQFVDVQAGRSKLKKELVDIKCLFDDMEDYAIKAIGDKKLTFASHLPSKIDFELFGDYQKIESILEELIDNAVKFSSVGEIHLGVRRYGEGALDDVEFFVIDAGIGIEDQNQNKVFDAFYQVDTSAKRRYGGLGMGLTTAQSLANLMGGAISIDSTFGEGCEFKLQLPLYSLNT